MDEPTNHLDIDAISALSIALNSFNGGLVIVSHDSYFVGSLCNEIYIVNHQKIKKHNGDFKKYREDIIKQINH